MATITSKAYKKMKADALRKYQDEIKAIELVWQQHGAGSQKSLTPTQGTLPMSQANGGLNQFEQIKEAVLLAPQPFSLQDIKLVLPGVRPGYLTTAFYRLSKPPEPLLKVVKETKPKKYIVLSKEKASAH